MATPAGNAWATAYEAYQRLRSKSLYITATVDRDGSFRIDDVPDGQYRLAVRFSEHAAGGLAGHRFAVLPAAEGSPTEPVDLGTLELQKQ